MNTLILDLFGTLIPCPTRSGHMRMIESMAKKSGLTSDLFGELWHETYKERIRGEGGTSKGFIDHMFNLADIEISEGLSIETASIWDDYTSSLFEFFPDVEPTLVNLKKHDVKIGLLTNCGSNVPEIFSSFDIAGLFDSTCFSSEVGLVKPSREFYIRALSDIGSDPSETLFTGDGDNGELSGAKEVGMQSVKIDRGVDKGDYRITADEPWDPTIASLNELSVFF